MSLLPEGFTKQYMEQQDNQSYPWTGLIPSIDYDNFYIYNNVSEYKIKLSRRLKLVKNKKKYIEKVMDKENNIYYDCSSNDINWLFKKIKNGDAPAPIIEMLKEMVAIMKLCSVDMPEKRDYNAEKDRLIKEIDYLTSHREKIITDLIENKNKIHDLFKEIVEYIYNRFYNKTNLQGKIIENDSIGFLSSMGVIAKGNIATWVYKNDKLYTKLYIIGHPRIRTLF